MTMTFLLVLTKWMAAALVRLALASQAEAMTFLLLLTRWVTAALVRLALARQAQAMTMTFLLLLTRWVTAALVRLALARQAQARQAQGGPSLTSYKIRKRKATNAPCKPKNKKKILDPESVVPIDVLPILQKKKVGRDVIQYIRVEKCLKKSHQENMMAILYAHVAAEYKSPDKYYPDRRLKLALAKGIITAFPELMDDGDCPWKTWLNKVTTKFETVQSHLPPEKKKYKYFNNSKKDEEKTSHSEANSSTSSTGEDTASSNDNLINSMTLWMNDAVPNPQNKKEISLGLKRTFEVRNSWIKKDKPTCTDILIKYKHLASFEGDMILEEFGRKEILAEELVPRFCKVAPFICKYFEKQKPESLVREVYDKFEDVNVRALLVLPNLLPPYLSSRSTDPSILLHIKTFKRIIDQVPSSALLQIAPAGTDPESYVSSEYCEEECVPIYPFLLWCSSDMVSGDLYLKIDRRTIRVASFDKNNCSENPVLKAVSLAIKAAHVFNLSYHPQLRNVFSYLEHLMCLHNAVTSTVTSFISAIRELLATNS